MHTVFNVALWVVVTLGVLVCVHYLFCCHGKERGAGKSDTIPPV